MEGMKTTETPEASHARCKQDFDRIVAMPGGREYIKAMIAGDYVRGHALFLQLFVYPYEPGSSRSGD